MSGGKGALCIRAVSCEVDGLSPRDLCPLTPAPSLVFPASFGVLES